MRIHKISALLCFLSIGLQSQSWDNVIRVGGIGKESITVMADGIANEVVIGGIYDAPFNWNGVELPTVGQDDLFLACKDSLNQWKWVFTAGGIIDDAWAQVIVDKDGNLICTGLFGVAIEFGEVRLESKIGSKSIFVLKLNPEGVVLWATSFDGNNLKEVKDVSTDDSGNIFLTGYFKETLFLGDTSLVAHGETDVFIAKLNAQGEPQWGRQFGGRKDTRGVGVGVLPDGGLVVTGYYNDTTYFENFSLAANTFDRDIFVLGLDEYGTPLWARRAGGVFDEEPLDMKIADNGDIWLTGYLIGVLTLEEGFSVQSTNGTTDLFLLCYSADGRPIAAKTWGGVSPCLASSLDFLEQTVILAGFYNGNVNLSGNLPVASTMEAGFVGAFDQQGQSLWSRSIQASGPVFINKVLVKGTTIWVAGTFEGSMAIGSQSLVDNGGFDGFLANLSIMPTALNTDRDPLMLKLFPNPVGDTLFIETSMPIQQIRLKDYAGKIVFQANALEDIDVSRFPAGVYFLQLDTKKESLTLVVLIQR
ncbi:MAG: T9SS type A sorting domain-containing protein [Saprospiraceae bacterium]